MEDTHIVQRLYERVEKTERELLGRLFYDNSLIPRAMALVATSDFVKYRQYYEKFIEIHTNEQDFSFEISRSKLSTEVFTSEVSFRPITRICGDFHDSHNALKVFGLLEQTINEFPERDVIRHVSELQGRLLAGVKDINNNDPDIGELIASYKKAQEDFRIRFKKGEGLMGIPTGYSKLDEVIDGFRGGHLWVIGAYTSLGKTSASLNLAANLIRQHKRVVFYSLEMSATDVLSRLLGIMTHQNGNQIYKGFAQDDKILDDAMKQIQNSRFAVNVSPASLTEIIYSMQNEHARDHVDLFIVDFMQLIIVDGAKSEYESMTIAARELQKAVQKLDSSLIVLSQISNEGAKYGAREVMAFKGSGGIAAAADLAIEIVRGEKDINAWRQKMRDGNTVVSKWNIMKNRHGRVGYIDMLFDGRTGIFKQDTMTDVEKQAVDRAFAEIGS